jgi:hypothetical protein
MKTYHSKDLLKRVFFDTHLRLWTMISLDADGNQIGSADYTTDRLYAFTWLAS